jgi:hypothetical protein
MVRGGTMSATLKLLWWLIVGHVVADFWAQSDALATLKNRHRNNSPFLPWYYALSAHALMHGAAVAFITNNIGLGIIETVAHWIIDFGRCEGWYDIHVDQFMHICFKAYMAAIAAGLP